MPPALAEAVRSIRSAVEQHSFHPETALFRNFCVSPPEADKSAGLIVRRINVAQGARPKAQGYCKINFNLVP
jgi:hypothetical protein